MSGATIEGLTLTETLVIHELLIESFGGIRGVTEQGFGKIEGALAAPDMSMFGEDLYVGLPAKAAALFYRLVRAHGFSDGNKRVALVALIAFLQRNGARLRASEDELYEVTMAAATDASQEALAMWLADRIEDHAD